MSPLLNAYDLVAVQEDFFYHDALVSQAIHAHQSVKDTTVGLTGLPLGDGLNTLSRSPFGGFTRITWDDCFGIFTNDNDCLTNKGLTFARHELEPGAFLDVYNWHTDSGTADVDLEACRSNVRQLYGFIEANSAGNAVLVLGDTNSRYTRAGDILPEMLAAVDLFDVWLELVRGGSVPGVGPFLDAGCAADPDGPDCELIDKTLYRSGARLELTPPSYEVPGNFVDAAGAPLSDHLPISATFRFTAVPAPTTACLALLLPLVLLSRSRRRSSGR